MKYEHNNMLKSLKLHETKIKLVNALRSHGLRQKIILPQKGSYMSRVRIVLGLT